MAQEYAFKLLQNRDNISSADFPLECDNDYLMSVYLTATYDEDTSPYILTFGTGKVKKGRYCIPDMTISRRL